MDELAPGCVKARVAYEKCFNQWYSGSFLKGKDPKDGCEDIFEEYQSCVLAAVRTRNLGGELKTRGATPRDPAAAAKAAAAKGAAAKGKGAAKAGSGKP